MNSSEAIVAYLDLLGYKELMRTNADPTKYYASIDTAIKRWYVYLDKHKHNIGGMIRKHISMEIIGDALVVVLDQRAALVEAYQGDDPHNRNVSVLKNLMIMVHLTFVTMLLQDVIRSMGLLFRGAITEGKYYSNVFENLPRGSFVFSRALAEAYDIAESVADFPRIILDNSLLGRLDMYNFERKDWPDRLAIRDVDGCYYLNIYASVYGEPEMASVLNNVSKIINKALVEHKNNLKIFRKYVWFSDYHNKFLEEALKVQNSSNLSLDEAVQARIQIPGVQGLV